MSGKRRPPVATWRNAVRDSDLKRTAKLVALVLSTYLNSRGRAYPSRSTLAKGASVCDRAVDAAITELETAGFLKVKRKGGRSRPNKYWAQLPNSEGGSPFSDGDDGNSDDSNGDDDDVNSERDDAKGRTARHVKGEARSPKA